MRVLRQMLATQGRYVLTRAAAWRAEYAGLFLASLLAVLVRVPFFFWPLTTDEGGYAYTAHWWFRGLPLYSDQLWFDRPQGIFLAYQLGMSLLGDSTWAIRLWGALWAAGTAAGVYLVARRLLGRQEAIVSAVLCALFSAAPQLEGFTANAKVFMALFTTLSSYYILTRKPIQAGILASAAVLLKPSGASAFLLAVVWLAHERAGLSEWEQFILASIPLPLAALAHGAMTVGLTDYANAVFMFRVGTRQAAPLFDIIRSWISTSPAWGPLAILAIPGVYRVPWRTRAFVLTWLLSSLAGMALGGNWFWHYFIQIMAPLSVCAGIGLSSLVFNTRDLFRFTGLAWGFLYLLLVGHLMVAQPKQGAWELYHRPGYLVAEDVANYIRTHTEEGDSIYIAFFESDIYHLAHRRSAFPHLYRLELTHIPGAYERLVNMVEMREPMYIVALDPPLKAIDPGDHFRMALEKGYRVETTCDGIPIYRRE